MRQLDTPLARIKVVLDLPSAATADARTAYWGEQEQDWKAKQELAGFLINQLTGKETAMYDVSVRDLPARTLLSTSEHLTVDQISEFATPLFALFGGPTIPRPEGEADRPFLRCHSELSNDSDGLVEFCYPIDTTDIAETTDRFPDMTSSTEQAGRDAYISVPKANMMTALGFESLYQWLVDHHEQAD